MKIYGKISHIDGFSKWEKIDMGIIYGKMYNSQTRTFFIRTGEKFIDETGHNKGALTQKRSFLVI